MDLYGNDVAQTNLLGGTPPSQQVCAGACAGMKRRGTFRRGVEYFKLVAANSAVTSTIGGSSMSARTKATRTLAVVGVAACALSAGLATPAWAADTGGSSYQADLKPIETNNVTGSGSVSLTLNGDSATVHMTVQGLLDGAPHAQHIHVDGMGQCPTAANATVLNGKRAISVTDAAPEYGKIGASLTVSGDTSPKAALAVKNFASTGSYTYDRTITLDPNVVSNIMNGTAVVVVHGIDYNGNRKYDDVLGASELDKSLPQEATAPALCGPLVASQMSNVPNGAANTGGGSAAASPVNGAAVGAGALALLLAGGFGAMVYRRRHSTQNQIHESAAEQVM